MSSKTSWYDKIFSKAIVKADLRNNWVWSAVMTVILVLNALCLPEYHGVYSHRVDFLSHFGVSLFFSLLFALFLGARLFSYLNKPNSVSMMHGLPFSRKTLYLSHLISGTILITVPVLAACVLAVLTNPAQSTPENVGKLVAAYMVYALLSFAISCFAMTVCGNVVVSTLFSGWIVVCPAAILLFILAICELNIYGFTIDNEAMNLIFEFLYVFPTFLFPWRFAVYLCFAAVFFAGGFFVYLIRPLENCEEVVAFKRLHPLFIYSIGLVCGMISYLFFNATYDWVSPVGMLPIGIIGILVSTMISKKSVNLKGTLRHVAIFSLAVCLFSAVISLDLLGVEKRVPKVQDVEYVEIPSAYFSYSNYMQDSFPDTKIEKPEDIEKITALHKAYIKDENTEDMYKVYQGFTFVYHLKNGSTLKRTYRYMHENNEAKYWLDVYNIDEYKQRNYSIADTTDKEILSAHVTDNRIKAHEYYFAGTSVEAQKLYSAVVSDINRLPYENLVANGTLSIRFTYFIPGHYISDPDHVFTSEEKTKYDRYFTVYVNENFTETLKVLEESGISLDYDDIEKVKYIVAEIGDGDNPKTETIPVHDYGKSVGVRLTRPEEIKEVYDIIRLGTKGYRTLSQSEESLHVTFVFVNENDEFMWTYYLPFFPEELPEFLQ